MSRVIVLRGTGISTWTLALIAVCLRFTARRLSRAGFWYDDWLMIPAAVSSGALCFASILQIPNRWILYDIDIDMIHNFNKAIIVSEICWAIAIWLVKSSILAFYWRLFSTRSRSFRVTIWVLGVIVSCWGIVVILLKLLCNTSYSLATDCIIPTRRLFVDSSIPHVITDVVLIGLPVPLIWKLHMHKTQKAFLTAIFALGSFVTIASIVRLIFLSKGHALENLFGLDYIDIFIWTNVEVNMSIICACLPCLRPILSLISTKLKLLRNHKSTHKTGAELLMDMLPARHHAQLHSPSATQLSREQTNNDGPHPMLDSSTRIEIEANSPRKPELDAEAPGPHILEIETVERLLEMSTQGPVAELEGECSHVV